jgi:ATP-binding cassette subfamily B protein
MLGPGAAGCRLARQLLAFARVSADPGLVILDEASSRLDPATEARIERAVARLLRDRTGIIIAHRLATVQRADEILILDDGRLVEHGDRAELAAARTAASALLRAGLEEVLAWGPGSSCCGCSSAVALSGERHAVGADSRQPLAPAWSPASSSIH